MRMLLLALLFSYTAVRCSTLASAQELTLSIDHSGSAHIRPGDVSEPLRLTVSRSGTVADSDFLTGWQASLALIPDDDTLGSLNFGSASEPEIGYVFDSIDSLGVSTVISETELFAFDSHFPFNGGAGLESGTSANLLELTLDASDDTLGRFGLFAVNGLGSSEWTDASQPISLKREFANVRDSDATIRLADIVVAHPGDFDFDNDVDGQDFLLWQR